MGRVKFEKTAVIFLFEGVVCASLCGAMVVIKVPRGTDRSMDKAWIGACTSEGCRICTGCVSVHGVMKTVRRLCEVADTVLTFYPDEAAADCSETLDGMAFVMRLMNRATWVRALTGRQVETVSDTARAVAFCMAAYTSGDNGFWFEPSESEVMSGSEQKRAEQPAQAFVDLCATLSGSCALAFSSPGSPEAPKAAEAAAAPQLRGKAKRKGGRGAAWKPELEFRVTRARKVLDFAA
jgi:hypothetical protein